MFLKNITKKFLNREIISYIFFGVLTTIVNYCIYFLFTINFQVNYFIANIVSWFISVVFAYITNKFFVFELKTLKQLEILKELMSFISTRIISLIIEMLILYLFVDLIGISDSIVKVLAGIMVIIFNYFFSKFFIFK